MTEGLRGPWANEELDLTDLGEYGIWKEGERFVRK